MLLSIQTTKNNFRKLLCHIKKELPILKRKIDFYSARHNFLEVRNQRILCKGTRRLENEMCEPFSSFSGNYSIYLISVDFLDRHGAIAFDESIFLYSLLTVILNKGFPSQYEIRTVPLAKEQTKIIIIIMMHFIASNK